MAEELNAVVAVMHAIFTGLIFLLVKYVWDQYRVKHVYIIEDNPFDTSVIKINLKLDNAKIHYCENYTQFIIKKLLKRPDAVIIDYRLPDCDGDKIFNLCNSQAIPAIMMTANDEPIFGVDDKFVVRKHFNYIEHLKTFLKRNSIA